MARRITEKYLLHAFDGIMTDDDRIDPRVSISKWRSSCTTASILATGAGDIRTLKRLYSQRWYSTPIDETKRENRDQVHEYS